MYKLNFFNINFQIKKKNFCHKKYFYLIIFKKNE